MSIFRVFDDKNGFHWGVICFTLVIMLFTFDFKCQSFPKWLTFLIKVEKGMYSYEYEKKCIHPNDRNYQWLSWFVGTETQRVVWRQMYRGFSIMGSDTVSSYNKSRGNINVCWSMYCKLIKEWSYVKLFCLIMNFIFNNDQNISYDIKS